MRTEEIRLSFQGLRVRFRVFTPRCAGDASRADGKLSSGRRGRMDGAGGHARRERLPVRSRGATRLRRERLRGGRVSGQRHARADSVGHFRRGGAPPRRKAVRVAPDRPRKRRRRHHDDDAVSGGQREIARADQSGVRSLHALSASAPAGNAGWKEADRPLVPQKDPRPGAASPYWCAAYTAGA